MPFPEKKRRIDRLNDLGLPPHAEGRYNRRLCSLVVLRPVCAYPRLSRPRRSIKGLRRMKDDPFHPLYIRWFDMALPAPSSTGDRQSETCGSQESGQTQGGTHQGDARQGFPGTLQEGRQGPEQKCSCKEGCAEGRPIHRIFTSGPTRCTKNITHANRCPTSCAYTTQERSCAG